MITYCLSYKKDTKNIDPKVIKTKNNRKMMLLRCSICNNKNSTFTAEPSALARISQGSGIFDSLVYNTNRDRMNNVINRFLLAGDKFMPENLCHKFIALVDLLLDIKKELKNLKKQMIRVIFIEINLIKLVFNMILLLQIIKI